MHSRPFVRIDCGFPAGLPKVVVRFYGVTVIAIQTPVASDEAVIHLGDCG